MKNKTGYTIAILCIFVIIISTLLTGCGGSSRKQAQQNSTQNEQTSKVPDQLTDMETSIEMIIKAMNGPTVETEEDKNKKPQQQNQNQSKSEKGQGGDQQGGQKQSGGQQGEKGQTSQQPQQQDPWEIVTPVINDLHYKWNSLMPQAVKAGASKSLVENFSNAINNLTVSIINKDKTNTLLAANGLYGYIPDLYSLYKSPVSPEIKRIRYYTRSAMLNSFTGNWAQAETDINNLKSSWSLYKNTLGKDQQDDSDRIDFSIYELEKILSSKNQNLIDIKGRIAMSNIGSLEKALKKASGKGSSS